ncbi:hypothetical protein C2G38_2083372 [Gigaspora rosea]|uniref:Transposase putative helix-turn-helix domain-containing protein n=1 Tax=Gigaspora rosea TaxID=44941 RepID=A0A397VBX6_9GLOM|nr:hypothetical protein C2G38_2083372 [Gigaspora rosea]
MIVWIFTFETMNKDVSNLKTKNIQVYPNREQREKLLRWMGTARWVYNSCVDFC